MASREASTPSPRRPRQPLRVLLVPWALQLLLVAGGAEADSAPDPDAINARLYEALRPPRGSGRIETVAGQMYLSKENIDAATIS